MGRGPWLAWVRRHQLREHKDRGRGSRYGRSVDQSPRQFMLVLELQLRIVELQRGRGRGRRTSGDAVDRDEARSRRRGATGRRGPRRWILDHLDSVGLALVDYLLIVGVHNRLLAVVVDEVDHLVLADRGFGADAAVLGFASHGRGLRLLLDLAGPMQMVAVLGVVVLVVVLMVVEVLVLGVQGHVTGRLLVELEDADGLHRGEKHLLAGVRLRGVAQRRGGRRDGALLDLR